MLDDIPKNLEIFSVRGVNKCDVVFRPLYRIHISICVCYTVYDTLRQNNNTCTRGHMIN